MAQIWPTHLSPRAKPEVKYHPETRDTSLEPRVVEPASTGYDPARSALTTQPPLEDEGTQEHIDPRTGDTTSITAKHELIAVRQKSSKNLLKSASDILAARGHRDRKSGAFAIPPDDARSRSARSAFSSIRSPSSAAKQETHGKRWRAFFSFESAARAVRTNAFGCSQSLST